MHTAVTDLNPNFSSGLLMAFLGEEDAQRNGYDHARGPCSDKKKWVISGDKQVFIPIDEIDCFDIDLLFVSGEEIEDDIDEVYGNEDPEVLAALYEFRQFYPTDAWGIELKRPPHDADVAPNFTIEVPERIGLKKVAPEEIISIDGVDADTFERWLQEASEDTFCLYGDCSEDRVDCCMKEEFLPSHVGNHVPLVAHHNWRCRLNEDPRRGMSHGKWSTRQEKPWLASHDSIRHMEIAN